jgi:hypothetical protein
MFIDLQERHFPSKQLSIARWSFPFSFSANGSLKSNQGLVALTSVSSGFVDFPETLLEILPHADAQGQAVAIVFLPAHLYLHL